MISEAKQLTDCLWANESDSMAELPADAPRWCYLPVEEREDFEAVLAEVRRNCKANGPVPEEALERYAWSVYLLRRSEAQASVLMANTGTVWKDELSVDSLRRQARFQSRYERKADRSLWHLSDAQLEAREDKVKPQWRRKLSTWKTFRRSQRNLRAAEMVLPSGRKPLPEITSNPSNPTKPIPGKVIWKTKTLAA